jgi:hypothetical protein
MTTTDGTTQCVSAAAAGSTCPTDTSMAVVDGVDRCVAPPTCPAGTDMTTVNGASQCVAPPTCPAGTAMTTLDGSSQCVAATGTSTACPTGAAATADMPAGCHVDTAAPAEVEALSAVKPVSASSSGLPAIVTKPLGAVAGALAFTGLNALTMLLVAVGALVVGLLLVRSARRREGAEQA